ncbi:unnamed protein product [Eruca vesicaria subsp. sativa]|uniref:Cystatin domain-containing protein n=1 Tax=Eruca vesicaria subsp. sativa TaxID=29727 RepID=A0ABC8LBD4_ERUVS|nr:unnamed protein product [Eruca vesicaria subsp. sativa]
MSKLSLVRLSLLGFLVITVVTPSVKSAVLGGKTNVANTRTNLEIQELGRYCVKQFNLQQQSKQGNEASIALSPLKFSRVVSAQKQVVAGTRYDLKIEVTQPDGTSRMFDSVIVIQPWLFSKKLIEFTPVK